MFLKRTFTILFTSKVFTKAAKKTRVLHTLLYCRSGSKCKTRDIMAIQHSSVREYLPCTLECYNIYFLIAKESSHREHAHQGYTVTILTVLQWFNIGNYSSLFLYFFCQHKYSTKTTQLLTECCRLGPYYRCVFYQGDCSYQSSEVSDTVLP